MNLYSFMSFLYVVILVSSIVLSVAWVFAQRNHPYVNVVDKVLVLIFVPFISVILYSFILMGFGYFFGN